MSYAESVVWPWLVWKLARGFVQFVALPLTALARLGGRRV